MSIKIVSITAASLMILGGVAFAEPDHAGAYRPASPSEPTRQDIQADLGVDRMPTASIAIPAGTDVGSACGFTSSEGGGEPTSVDASSPSVPNC